MSELKKLYLSQTDKKLAGVCGGLGEYFNTDSSLIRLASVIIVILSGIFPGVIAYIVAALVIPKPPLET